MWMSSSGACALMGHMGALGTAPQRHGITDIPVPVLHHHGPPELFLHEGQGPLLALVAHIMVDTILGCTDLTSRDNKG